MYDKTSIEWTDATWSPIRYRVKKDAGEIAQAKGYMSLVQIASKMAGHVGQFCEHCSPGCENCWSGTNQARCLPTNGTGLPFDRRSRDLVEPFLDENALLQPLKWKRGRRIFVENQSDLFGEWIPDQMIDRVFAVMALCPQHTFQVLTKRAKRKREYFADLGRVGEEVAGHVFDLLPRRLKPGVQPVPRLPLPNVWLGVSVEDQQRADERIPDLLATPAAVRFLSVEPLLGPVDIGRAIPCGYYCDEAVGHVDHPFWTVGIKSPIDWVIVGGESGPGARPMHPDWVRAIRDQCVAAAVPFFFKQWGAWHPGYIERCYEVKGYRPSWEKHPEAAPWWPDGTRGIGDHKTNGGMAVSWRRIGAKRAGRLLNGREWSQFPEAKEASLVSAR